MGCSESSPLDSSRIKAPVPANLSGFGGLTALNLFRCIESLNKTKEADDKVMLENRALARPLHSGTLLCGPYMIQLPDPRTGNPKSFLVQDPGEEVEKIHKEFRRMVLTGQDLKPWLKKEPEFHRRILAACYANRVVLRKEGMVFESHLNVEWIAKHLVAPMSNTHILRIASAFRKADVRECADLASWIDKNAPDLEESIFFATIPYLLESRRPGALDANEFVVFVDKLATMSWSDAARFVFAKLTNASTSLGEPAIDLIKLAKSNPMMSEAKTKDHPINVAIQRAKVKAYGKNPHTRAEEVGTHASGKNDLLAPKLLWTGADESVNGDRPLAHYLPVDATNDENAEEYTGAVLTLKRHMWMAQHSGLYMYPVMFLQTWLRQQTLGEDFWAKRKLALDRAKQSGNITALELYNKNAVESYLAKKSDEFMMARDENMMDAEKAARQKLMDLDSSNDPEDAVLDFKVVTLSDSGLQRQLLKEKRVGSSLDDKVYKRTSSQSTAVERDVVIPMSPGPGTPGGKNMAARARAEAMRSTNAIPRRHSDTAHSNTSQGSSQSIQKRSSLEPPRGKRSTLGVKTGAGATAHDMSISSLRSEGTFFDGPRTPNATHPTKSSSRFKPNTVVPSL